MISCFKGIIIWFFKLISLLFSYCDLCMFRLLSFFFTGSATDDWKTDFENHAASYTR